MTSFIHRLRQRERETNKQYYKVNIEDYIKKDWEGYQQIDGIAKWINEHPDQKESLRKHRAALVRHTLKKQAKEKPDGK